MAQESTNQGRILVVDDSSVQRLKVKSYLEQKGFTANVAEGGEEMKALFAKEQFDIVLLDVNMPGDDGFTLVPWLREHQTVGIIMLTASDELVDRVLGLELGADDYVTKPFEPRELMARIKSVLRRVQSLSGNTRETASDSQVSFGNYQLDMSSQQLLDEKGNHVGITSMEFDLLRAFAENPGRVLDRDTLLNLAHNRDWDPYDRSIDIRIARIRRKIEPNPSKPSIIKTVRGSGYIFLQES
ncbi:MAG: response regulator [Granulosicoccus sp.]|nr:response regulator [Granulosicoccus sp.]